MLILLNLQMIHANICYVHKHDGRDNCYCCLNYLMFFSVQLGVNIFLALIVGVIFWGVKDDQSGIQNR